MLKAPSDELRRCEGILAYLYGIMFELKKTIVPADLQAMGFNFAISSGEYLE